jgi:hypothetical protein
VKRLALASYPFLLGAMRVLYQANHSPGYYTVPDLLLVLAVTLGVLAAVYALAALVFRRGPPGIPALVTFLFLLWLFLFPEVARKGHMGRPVQLGLAIVWLIGSALVVRWVRRRPAALPRAAAFLTLTGALLTIRFVIGIAIDRGEAHEQVAHSGLAHALARPIPGPAAIRGPRRDVYLILLDEYANADVLRDGYGFDNRKFLDSLRALGFHVPRATWSNYAHTSLSLPSLLNAAHVRPLADELPRGAKDPTLVNYLLEQSRVARYLQARGYRYILFPSAWWGSTQSSPIADSVVRVWTGFNLDRELSHSEFRRVIRRATPFDLLRRDEPWYADFVRRTLDGVSALPSVREPVFAFVHVLSPHGPWVFDRDCRLPERHVMGRDPKGLYTGQIECLNGLVLATVNHLIRDSDVPPVIILQGDHGSHRLGFAKAHRVEEVTASAAWERFGAFGAYYLPDGGAAAFGDSVSVVNVMGNVLRYYFGAELPREPDDRYLSVEDDPFRFIRPEPAWLVQGELAAAKGQS